MRPTIYGIISILNINRIGFVMVSVFDSSAVDRGFKSRSGHTTVYKIGICSFSAKNAPLRRQAGWLGIRIMCPSGATYLTAGCCFNELALATSNSECRSSTKRISSSSH
jgi:hypothetical protein